jgi:hypothetical protein
MYRVHMNEAFWFTTLQFQSQPRETDQCMNIGSPKFLCRLLFDLLEPWDVRALSIRKTADLPLQLWIGTFPRFVAIGFYFLSETLIFCCFFCYGTVCQNYFVSNHVNSEHVPSFSYLDVWYIRHTTSGVYAITARQRQNIIVVDAVEYK